MFPEMISFLWACLQCVLHLFIGCHILYIDCVCWCSVRTVDTAQKKCMCRLVCHYAKMLYSKKIQRLHSNTTHRKCYLKNLVLFILLCVYWIYCSVGWCKTEYSPPSFGHLLLQMWDESCNSCWCWLSCSSNSILLSTPPFSFPSPCGSLLLVF